MKMSPSLSNNDTVINKETLPRTATELLAFRMAAALHEQIEAEITLCIEESDLADDLNENEKAEIEKHVIRSFVENYGYLAKRTE